MSVVASWHDGDDAVCSWKACEQIWSNISNRANQNVLQMLVFFFLISGDSLGTSHWAASGVSDSKTCDDTFPTEILHQYVSEIF